MLSSDTPFSSSARLILASGSVYRKELLQRLQIPFSCVSPDIDETPLPGELPQETALRLAQQKAQHVARQHAGSIVIGSDQVATLDQLQIGKPGNHQRALEQLMLMRGREVIFHTALCVTDSREHAEHPVQLVNVQTRVTMRNLPEHELDAYLRIEQPYDCAGSAKNEGLGIALLESVVSDDPTALTGLPMIALTGMLRRCGVPFFSAAQPLSP